MIAVPYEHYQLVGMFTIALIISAINAALGAHLYSTLIRIIPAALLIWYLIILLPRQLKQPGQEQEAQPEGTDHTTSQDTLILKQKRSTQDTSKV